MIPEILAPLLILTIPLVYFFKSKPKRETYPMISDYAPLRWSDDEDDYELNNYTSDASSIASFGSFGSVSS